MRGSDVVFIAVGTPQRDDGDADLRAAMSVAQQVADCAERYTVVVNKSTVPVGTAARMQAEIAARARRSIAVDHSTVTDFARLRG